MEKDFSVISDDLSERKFALEHYPEEIVSIKKGVLLLKCFTRRL